MNLETQTELRLRELLSTNSIQVGNVSQVSPTQFKIEGIQDAQDAAFRQTAAEVEANFDRSSGVGGVYTFTLKPNVQQTLRDEAVVQARQTIERRVNELGVAEPIIAQQGTDQILVQLPGVTDVNRAKDIIGSPGLLELKIVEQGPSAPKRHSRQRQVRPAWSAPRLSGRRARPARRCTTSCAKWPP